jgi:DNA replication protein DnaC
MMDTNTSANKKYQSNINTFRSFTLLILYDFGVTPLKNDEVNDLFEVIEERMFNGSIVMSAAPQKIIFRSNHASNALHLARTLPKERLIHEIDHTIRAEEGALVS